MNLDLMEEAFGSLAPQAALDPVAYNPQLAGVGWKARQERIFRNRGAYGALPLSNNVVDERALPPVPDDGQGAMGGEIAAPQPLGTLSDQAGYGALSQLLASEEFRKRIIGSLFSDMDEDLMFPEGRR
jgi:hypothetical protein